MKDEKFTCVLQGALLVVRPLGQTQAQTDPEKMRDLAPGVVESVRKYIADHRESETIRNVRLAFWIGFNL